MRISKLPATAERAANEISKNMDFSLMRLARVKMPPTTPIWIPVIAIFSK
jgi:hypothetical protein